MASNTPTFGAFLFIMSEYTDYQEGNTLVEIFITEPEDLPIIKQILKNVKMGMIVKAEKVNGGWDIHLLLLNMTALYLLGRYVGCDRKRLHDLDF